MENRNLKNNESFKKYEKRILYLFLIKQINSLNSKVIISNHL